MPLTVDGCEDVDAGRATSARASIVTEAHLRGWRTDRAYPSAPRAPPAGRRGRPWFPAGTTPRAVRCGRDTARPSLMLIRPARSAREALFRDWSCPGGSRTPRAARRTRDLSSWCSRRVSSGIPRIRPASSSLSVRCVERSAATFPPRPFGTFAGFTATSRRAVDSSPLRARNAETQV